MKNNDGDHVTVTFNQPSFCFGGYKQRAKFAGFLFCFCFFALDVVNVTVFYGGPRVPPLFSSLLLLLRSDLQPSAS